MVNWAVYDTASGELCTFETREEAKEYLKETVDDLDLESETSETVYLMEIKERRFID